MIYNIINKYGSESCHWVVDCPFEVYHIYQNPDGVKSTKMHVRRPG